MENTKNMATVGLNTASDCKAEINKLESRMEFLQDLLTKLNDAKANSRKQPRRRIKRKYKKVVVNKKSPGAEEPAQAQPEENTSRYAFVLNTLQYKNKLLSVNDFVFVIMSKFKSDSKEIKTLRSAISEVLKNMVYKQRKLNHIYISHLKTHYYGLPEWFQDKNIPKKEYLEKLQKELSLN